MASAEIISRVYSAQGRDNWETIFGKKSAFQWMEHLYGDSNLIMDADGWPGDDGVYLDTPITRSDFNTRFNHCTIRNLPKLV